MESKREQGSNAYLSNFRCSYLLNKQLCYEKLCFVKQLLLQITQTSSHVASINAKPPLGLGEEPQIKDTWSSNSHNPYLKLGFLILIFCFYLFCLLH